MLRRARIDVRVGQNEKRVLWHKLARIAPLAAATSVSGRTVGELRNDPEWRPKLDARDRRGLRGRRGRRRLAAPGGPVGDHRRDGRRDDDLRGARRRRRTALRARRDPRRRPAHRRAPRRPLPDADGARRRRRARGEHVRPRSRSSRRVPGSERVPQKNVRPLAGHPLLAYAIETALQSGCFERVVVSTDSEEIADVARWYGADVPFLRPAEYATSTSPDIEWLAYTLEHLPRALRALRAHPRDQPVPWPGRRAARARAAARHAGSRLAPRGRAREAAPREDVAALRRRQHDGPAARPVRPRRRLACRPVPGAAGGLRPEQRARDRLDARRHGDGNA